MKLRLNPNLLRAVYSEGYFPMPHPETQELLWFRPDPRAILPLDGFHVSRSLKQTLKKDVFRVTTNKAFSLVMQCCAEREDEEGTWINDEFLAEAA